jgi:transposase-like protein
VSKETISRITDTVIEEMQTWSTRPLEEVYAVSPGTLRISQGRTPS